MAPTAHEERCRPAIVKGAAMSDDAIRLVEADGTMSLPSRIDAILAAIPSDVTPIALAALADKVWMAAARFGGEDHAAWRSLALELESRFDRDVID